MSSDIHSRIALVLGITGSLGAEAAAALHRHGWQVRALHRNPSQAAAHPAIGCPIDWIAGDAMRTEDVRRAARGASVIIHAVNPPRYQRWRELAVPMLNNAIEAARESGARLVFPGNIYNFHPDAGPVLDEATPQRPLSRKGKVRAEMEARLADAAMDGVRSIVLRAGDYFGPHAASSWFGAAMVKPGKPVGAILYPGKLSVGHAWAYLPDLADTLARLLAQDARLPAFSVFHFAGHWLESGADMTTAICQAAGKDLPVRQMPWPLLRIAAPFSAFVREMLEMRYLWETPLRLDNGKLIATLGYETHTPLDDAVRTTLQAFGCLPRQAGEWRSLRQERV